MPKIIENLERRLLEVAKKQLAESGYGAVTIRSVARECGVGVGTVYNYFPSKDALLAAYMLEDWKCCISAIQKAADGSQDPKPVARCMYEQLQSFAKLHSGIFQDALAVTGFAGSFARYHSMLRTQLAQPLEKFCGSQFGAEFIAEAMLTWTMAGKEFDEIYSVIGKLF